MGMTKGMMAACAAVGVLGLITVILGIAGAASTSCDASPAVGCGVVASLLALTTQIVATAATGWGGRAAAAAAGRGASPTRPSASSPSSCPPSHGTYTSTASGVLAIIVVILFMVGAILSTGGGLPTYNDGKCVSPGTGPFVAATIMFFISMVCQIASYTLLQATSVAGSTKSPLAQESGIAMGQPAAAVPVPARNAEQKAAAAGDLPPLAPTAAAASELPPSAPAAAAAGDLPPPVSTASSEANVDPPPPSAPAMSPKASADPTSHV
uniref:Uncharacterized protein n=1 Tax=Aegilops tauschii TaxID=37682 RepID=N1R0J6_AEGTA